MTEGHGTPPSVGEQWEDFMADLEATAEEYREAGYEVLAIHTGDVTPLPDELVLDVLAPGEEFERLEELAEEFEVDEFEAYTAEDGETTFALVVAKDESRERAICCPVFYHETVAAGLGARAKETGLVNIVVRPLSDDSQVVFTLEEPELLF